MMSIASVRASLDEARSKMARAHEEGRSDAAALHAADVDRVLMGLFQDATSRLGDDGVVLVALGGYGRSELAPYSDLDLLLLHRGRTTEDVERINRALMYPLWDAGSDVGNRVRDPREVLRSLERTDEATAALDARMIAGDRGLFLDFQGSVLRHLQRGRATLFKALVDANLQRHERQGHAGHILEPDVRDSAGGLRDIHTLRWAAKVLPGSGETAGLADAGYLTRLDVETLREAYAFLLAVRIASHLRAGRRMDRLLVGDQDDLAFRCGYADADGIHAGDRFMRDVHRRARDAEAIVSAAWERLTHRKPRRPFRSAARAIGDGCVVLHGRLEVLAATSPHEDAAGWLRAFRHAVVHGAAMGRASLARLRESIGADEVLPWSPDAREIFLDLLRRGRQARPALEAMDESGFLGALLPDWRPLRALPQRDPYHRYTVDIHLFETVSELVDSRDSSEPAVVDAWSRAADADALLLAGLFHDAGKGREGDHSRVGAGIARSAIQRMGASAGQTETVAFLVQEHLTLADAATHRDLNDERTVREVVSRVGSPERLAALYLLTRADSIATGKEAWSTFRASLVTELYSRALAAMTAGGAAPPGVEARRAQLLAVAAADSAQESVARIVDSMPSAWLESFDVEDACRHLAMLLQPPGIDEVELAVTEGPSADEIVVVARDRPGLLAVICGALALNSIDVHRADAFTSHDGTALDVFKVTGRHGPVPSERWKSVENDIRSALRGELALDDALARKADHSRLAPRVRAASAPADVVIVDNAASDRYTVVEVRTSDRLGLLWTIAGALTRSGCDIAVAKVATYGSQVVDVFYVVDDAGDRITAPSRVWALRGELMSALAARARGA